MGENDPGGSVERGESAHGSEMEEGPIVRIPIPGQPSPEPGPKPPNWRGPWPPPVARTEDAEKWAAEVPEGTVVEVLPMEPEEGGKREGIAPVPLFILGAVAAGVTYDLIKAGTTWALRAGRGNVNAPRPPIVYTPSNGIVWRLQSNGNYLPAPGGPRF